VRELFFLHSRNVTFAVFCQGPFPESDRYREFLGWEMPFRLTLKVERAGVAASGIRPLGAATYAYGPSGRRITTSSAGHGGPSRRALRSSRAARCPSGS
jgi:hypothetical protein